MGESFRNIFLKRHFTKLDKSSENDMTKSFKMYSEACDICTLCQQFWDDLKIFRIEIQNSSTRPSLPNATWSLSNFSYSRIFWIEFTDPLKMLVMIANIFIHINVRKGPSQIMVTRVVFGLSLLLKMLTRIANIFVHINVRKGETLHLSSLSYHVVHWSDVTQQV